MPNSTELQSPTIPELFDLYQHGQFNFPYVDLRHTCLQGECLQGVIFHAAALDYAHLQRCNFRDVRITHTHFNHAILDGIDLQDAQVVCSYFEHASLKRANLKRANFMDASLTFADLSYSDCTDACFRNADFTNTNFTGALLTGSDLRGTNISLEQLRQADLSAIEADIYTILDASPNEVEWLLSALYQGRVDGSTYEGECACLVGTLANLQGVEVSDLRGISPDALRPAERWFLAINKGDTVENNPIVEVTVAWVTNWLKENIK